MRKAFSNKTFYFLLLVFISCFLLFAFASPALAKVDIGAWFKMGKWWDVPPAELSEECQEALNQLEQPIQRLPIVCVFPTVGSLISTILPNVYILAGLILFILLLFGGFSFIMGAGGGNPEQANKGKQAIGGAVAGFGLIFASYWVIQIIEYLTGIEIF